MKCVIYQVLYIPGLACNLLSVTAATAKGYHVKFGQSKCWIQDSNGKLCGMGSMTDKLYRLNCKLATVEHDISEHVRECNDMNLWHQRLIHLRM